MSFYIYLVSSNLPQIFTFFKMFSKLFGYLFPIYKCIYLFIILASIVLLSLTTLQVRFNSIQKYLIS